MAKVAMIGAGSLVFCKTLMNDMLATPALSGSEYCLMALTHKRLDKMQAFVKRMVEDNGVKATVTSTTDLRQALHGADYVVVMIQVGGMEAFGHDYLIPLKYGVDQCIGDTAGPGGVFRALRHIPALMEIAKAMRELCPNALLINYANPMAMCCWALGTVPGLQLRRPLPRRPDDDGPHRRLRRREEGGYRFPRRRHQPHGVVPAARKGRQATSTRGSAQNFEKPEYYINEKVRGEVMRHFGYFMTESTGHLSEYLPYFRKNKKALEAYCDQPDFGGATGAYYKYGVALAEKFDKMDPLSIESTKLGPRSAEYCSHIIEAARDRATSSASTATSATTATSPTSPTAAASKSPSSSTAWACTRPSSATLPPQLAALNMTNVVMQGLAVQAALTGDPELAMQAVALDPLASAVLTLKEIRDMTAEMLAAEAQWLPQFRGKALKAVPAVAVPKGTVGVEVPLDPALAIANRFVRLAEVEAPGSPEARREKLLRAPASADNNTMRNARPHIGVSITDRPNRRPVCIWGHGLQCAVPLRPGRQGLSLWAFRDEALPRRSASA